MMISVPQAWHLTSQAGLPLNPQSRLMIKSLGLDIYSASQACYLSLVLSEETLSPSRESLDILYYPEGWQRSSI